MKNIVILFLILIGINLCQDAETFQKHNNKTDYQLIERVYPMTPEHYYELLIADHIIELILNVLEKCSTIDPPKCHAQCYENFKTINDTINVSESVYSGTLKDYYHNPNVLGLKKMCATLIKGLSHPIKIKNGIYDYNSTLGFNGEYGPKGKKGPLGPYGPNGPFRTHRHDIKFEIVSNQTERIKPRRLIDPLIDLSIICEYVFGFFGFDTSNCED